MRIHPIFILLFLVSIGTFCTSPDRKSDGPSPAIPGVQQLTQRIVQDSLNPMWYAERGKLYAMNEAYDLAIHDLQQAIRLGSDQVNYYHDLANIYLDNFRSREALEVMEKAAERFPDSLRTELKLSEIQFTLKQYDASIQTVNRILQKQPYNAEAFFMLGMNFKEMGDSARAINGFQTAVEQDPHLVDGWIELGTLMQARHNPLAGQYFANAAGMDTVGAEGMYALAHYYHQEGLLEQAKSTYQQMLIKDPSYENAMLAIGLIYLEQDTLDKAFRCMDSFTQISITDPRGYYYKGYIEEKKGHISEARHWYQQALAFDPDFTRAQERLKGLPE